MDKDDSGTVTWVEASNHYLGVTPEELRKTKDKKLGTKFGQIVRVFKKTDKNCDNVLDLDEFLNRF